jgi:hypothetical protein
MDVALGLYPAPTLACHSMSETLEGLITKLILTKWLADLNFGKENI